MPPDKRTQPIGREPLALYLRRAERAVPAKQDSTYLFMRKRYNYEPTGLLTIRLSEGPSSWNIRTWNDGKRRCVESSLNEMMIGFVETRRTPKGCTSRRGRPAH